ncbi:MAG TPA: hypothetical protein VF868_05460 [Bacteroidia bacterium]
MQKHPIITASTSAASAHCPFTVQVLMKPLQLSPYAFQRHLRSHTLRVSSASLKVYALPCGCFVWVYASGKRQLSALPF